MLLSSLIFLFYTAFFIFILYRLSLKQSFVLSFKEASLAFIVKVLAGCFYGYFFLHYYGGDDTWFYHNESLKEFALLKSDPIHFFINDIFSNGYTTNQLQTVFDSSGSFAKDLEYTLLIKLLAIFDLFSGGNYYVNVTFYNAIVFSGCYCLYKTVVTKYPEKKLLWLLFIFYFPPLLFWTSGIRKDGLSFALTCGLIYQLYYLFEIRKSVKHIFYAVLIFFILFLLRNYIALTFLPVVIAYTISKKYPRFTAGIFALIIMLCATGFFITGYVSPTLNLPQKMADRQQAFLELKGNSYLPTDTLDGNFFSYMKVLPQALNHVFIRPYFSEAKGILYLFSFLDIAFFFFVLIRIFFKPSLNYIQILKDPFVLSLLTIALLNYIIIGYTVPFLGAIVRYRASFEILIIIVFIAMQTNPFNTNFLKRKNNSTISS